MTPTTTGRNVTEHFSEFTKGLLELAKKHSLILDGEIVFMDGKEGRGEVARKKSQSKPPLINLACISMRKVF